MLRTAADSFFSNSLTRPQTQISLQNQQASVLTQVYIVYNTTKTDLQKPHTLHTISSKCILNNMDGTQAKFTPSVYYLSNVAFYLYVLAVSLVHVCIHTEGLF